ncbi:type IV pilin [Halobacteriales archaeon QS_4_66_20]|nr:MAG: type IV pilin [Halobacteriales archaeon QS_4_66_20]
MNIKNLARDDDAVSPVIGVILMVAITVILAAVIASFVLGLGDQNNPAPTTDFDFNYDSSGPNVVVTHSDGDSLDPANVYMRGNFGSEVQWPSSNTNSDGMVASGNSYDLSVSGAPGTDGAEYTINVVWEDPDSDTTSTLSTDEGPDA